MRTFFARTVLLLFVVVSLSCLGMYAADGPADEAKDKNSTAKPAAQPNTAAKPDSGLTEREQWMLDRIEQLEKRVAELEAKAPSGTAASAAAPAPVSPSAPAPKAGTAPIGSSAAPAPATVAASPAAAVPGGTPASPANSTGAASAANAAAVIPGSSSSVNPPQNQNPPAAAAVSTTNPQPAAPFSDADWSWLNGNSRVKDIYWDTKWFTPEIRFDTNYVADFNHPTDHSIGGSSELFRSYEVQLEQLGLGGDFHWDNVRGRFMTQFGMYSETTPRNDASPAHGQWDLDTAYRYISEGYGGYHINALHGINIDAGIFMSYIGLFSYYNFDNWAYQPSYVSSNTPWFFNGVRVQIFPTEHLKIEPWFINGWQSYASANHTPGIGGQIKWTPTNWMNIISNNYGVGEDDVFTPGRRRIHTDNSIEIKYYENMERTLDRMAFSLTGDLGCEYGAGVSCYSNKSGGPKQSFAGWMGYNRFWFHNDLFGLTIGGGEINNPGRYLVLLPPINGETAISAATNSPYFPENPGDPFKAWDSSITFDYMPKQYITFRWEYDYRHASVPYWSGRGGITPPGGNNGYPQYYVCSNGSSSMQETLQAAETACGGGMSSVWFPDLRKDESFIDMAIMVTF
jgi:Putative beta-barrel porin-2, OmpL-like. bbp2